MRYLFSAAFLVLSVTAAAAAETPRQMQVSLAGLDLNRPAGQAAAQARIHAAAVRLCVSERFTESLSDRACVARAVESANAQVARFVEAN